VGGRLGGHEGEGITPYGVRLLDYREEADIKRNELHGLSVGEFYQGLDSAKPEGPVIVYGAAGDVKPFQNFTLFSLKEGSDVLAVLSKEPVPEGVFLIVSGYLHSLDGTTPGTFLLAENIADASSALTKLTKAADIEVYMGEKVIGRGTTKLEKYENTDVRRVMIDRGVLRDVYVIFSGVDKGRVSLTIKLVPLMNFIWFGVVLFVIGIAVVLLSERNARRASE
jgi:hypothetical protein